MRVAGREGRELRTLKKSSRQCAPTLHLTLHIRHHDLRALDQQAPHRDDAFEQLLGREYSRNIIIVFFHLSCPLVPPLRPSWRRSMACERTSREAALAPSVAPSSAPA